MMGTLRFFLTLTFVLFWTGLENITAQPIPLKMGHGNAVSCLAFSPDGKWLASGSGHIRMVYSYDDKYFFDGGRYKIPYKYFEVDKKEYEIRLWNLDNGWLQQILQAHKGSILSVAFSNHGKWLASSGLDSAIYLWKIPQGQLIRVFRWPVSAILQVVFSPDDRWLAALGREKSIHIWSLPHGKRHLILKGFKGLPSSLAFSPDGRYLASRHGDGTINLWQIPQGKLETVMNDKRDFLTSLSFSPDGHFLASSDEKNISIWIMPWGGLLYRLPIKRNLGSTLYYSSPEVLRAAFFYKNQIYFKIDSTNGLGTSVLSGHKALITAISFNKDGRLLASGDENGVIRLWDLARKRLASVLDGSSQSVSLATLNTNGTFLATASKYGQVTIWDIARLVRKKFLPSPDSLPLNTLTFSADGKYLAEKFENGAKGVMDISTGRYWEIKKGREIQKHILTGIDVIVPNSIPFVWHPQRPLLANSEPDGSIKLLDVRQQRTLKVLPSAGISYVSLAFHPFKPWLAAIPFKKERDLDYLIKIALRHREKKDVLLRQWDIRTGERVLALKNLSWLPVAIAYRPNSGQLFIADTKNNIHIWDGIRGRMEKTTFHCSNEIKTLTFSPDGRWLVCKNHSFIEVLDIKGKNRLMKLASFHYNLESAALIMDRDRIISVDDNGTILIWNIQREEWTVGAKFFSTSDSTQSFVLFTPDGRYYTPDKRWAAYVTVLNAEGQTNGRRYRIFSQEPQMADSSLLKNWQALFHKTTPRDSLKNIH